jgi:hypothetical protein
MTNPPRALVRLEEDRVNSSFLMTAQAAKGLVADALDTDREFRSSVIRAMARS